MDGIEPTGGGGSAAARIARGRAVAGGVGSLCVRSGRAADASADRGGSESGSGTDPHAAATTGGGIRPSGAWRKYQGSGWRLQDGHEGGASRRGPELRQESQSAFEAFPAGSGNAGGNRV